MRTPQIQNRSKDEQRQKKQLVILAALFVVLVGVVALQFGQGAATATHRTGDDNLPVASAKDSNDAIDIATAKPLDLSGNLALSEQDADGNALNDAAFESFWNLNSPIESMLEGAPPSNIRLSATLVGRKGVPDVAIINGSLTYVGDMIEGWSVESISSREVVLRSASQSVVNLGMPLLQPNTQAAIFRAAPTALVTSLPAETISDS